MEREEKRPKVVEDGHRELGRRLKTFSEEHRSELSVSADSIRSAEDVARVKERLERLGVVFVTEAVSEESLTLAKTDLCESMWQMFRHNLPIGTAKPTSLEGWNALRNARNGFGNASFGYVNKQFTRREETPNCVIGSDDKVFMTNNCVFSRVNLPLLERNPHLCAILLGLTHVSGGIVSVDSCKYSSNPRPVPKGMTKHTLTVPHVDIYDSSIERYQAMIVDEGAVKLGYVIGSHLLLDEISKVASIDLRSSLSLIHI